MPVRFVREEARAHNEALFRRINEEISAEYGRSASGLDTRLYLCECSDSECAESVELRTEEYERVRSHPTWFVLKPGHGDHDIERIVQTDDRFVIVDKIDEAGIVAEDTDPRED